MEIAIIIILTVVLLSILFSFLTYGKSGKVEPKVLTQKAVDDPKELTLLSINMAHGRGDGRNQILQSSEVIKKYVNQIGELIKREDANLVAMQEADAPSWWSGGFSHVENVAKLSHMHFALQGEHVSGLGLCYGASLIGNLKVIDAKSQTFERSIPTFSKGFVVVTCVWQGLDFDVVSLHLDFARDSVRKKQLNLLAEHLEKHHKPVVIMGDFNTDMSKGLLPNFMQRLNLHTWRENDKKIITFRSLGGSRIDWVLVSSEFEIVEHKVLDDLISDHQAVKVVLRKVRDE